MNHKLTPLALDKQFNIWLALCVVSHSSDSHSGNIFINKKNANKLFEYNLTSKTWIERDKPMTTEQEKQILNLSIRFKQWKK